MKQCICVLCVVAVAILSGCATTQPPATLVIGERVLRLAPGQTFVAPALTPPAKQWYVVDDVGLAQWLGIMVPGTTK